MNGPRRQTAAGVRSPSSSRFQPKPRPHHAATTASARVAKKPSRTSDKLACESSLSIDGSRDATSRLRRTEADVRDCAVDFVCREFRQERLLAG